MTVGDETVCETIVFLDYFSELPDPRQLIKVVYPLDEVLLLSLLAVLAGAETFTDIARFGEKKLDLLRRFRPFLNKTPTHDRLGEIFAALDAEQFQKCFVAWVAACTGISAEVIAIDGKTSRRSYQEKGRRADPYRLGLRRPPETGARPGQGDREVQRDNSHPQAFGHAGH
jgi:hypothetical protein